MNISGCKQNYMSYDTCVILGVLGCGVELAQPRPGLSALDELLRPLGASQ